MTSLREELKSLQDQVAENAKKWKILDDERYQLIRSQEEVSRKIILEEKMLQKTNWKLDRHGEKLLLLADKFSIHMPELSELAMTNYHCDFLLEEKIYLRFDDGEITILAPNPKELLSFAQKQNLTVDYLKVENRLKDLKDELQALAAWDNLNNKG